MSYAPQQGSVAWKVIEFLTTNPDEELTRDDIAAKFDCTSGNVHSLLRQSVDAGLLLRVETDDELVYRLGKGSPVIKPNKAANPSLRAPAGAWPGNVPPAHPASRCLRSIWQPWRSKPVSTFQLGESQHSTTGRAFSTDCSRGIPAACPSSSSTCSARPVPTSKRLGTGKCRLGPSATPS